MRSDRLGAVCAASILAAALSGVASASASATSSPTWPANACGLLASAQLKPLMAGATPGKGLPTAGDKSAGRGAACTWESSTRTHSVALSALTSAKPNRSELSCSAGTSTKVSGVGTFALYCRAPGLPAFEVQDGTVAFTIQISGAGSGPSESALESAARHVLKAL